MRRTSRWTVLLMLAAALAACGPEPPERPEEPPPQAAPQHYEGVGVVSSMVANKTFVVIRHEAIPGFMDAMSMPFAVQDTTVLAGIQPYDSVRFHLRAAQGEVVILQIEKIE